MMIFIIKVWFVYFFLYFVHFKLFIDVFYVLHDYNLSVGGSISMIVTRVSGYLLICLFPYEDKCVCINFVYSLDMTNNKYVYFL